MGVKKKHRAEVLKEAKKNISFAKLNDCPTSPRKMRLVADMIRGEEVFKALTILEYTPQHAAVDMKKLLRSAIANWEAKNGDKRPEDHKLIVKEVNVDGGRMLKRIKPAAQGRANRIRKRSNHVTIIIDSIN